MANAVNNAQNTNKCPHGFPAGTCPMCNGMAGSNRAKDKNKPRKAGEMSYNECMAVWIRMQRAKEAKMKDRLDKQEAIKQADVQKTLQKELAQIQNKINAYFNNLENIVQNFPPVLKFVALPIIKVAAAVVNVIINVAINFTNLISSISEKMAMVLSEVKNHITSFIEKTLEKSKKIIKTVLSLFLEFEEEEKDNSDKQKIKKIIENAVNKILRKEREDEPV